MQSVYTIYYAPGIWVFAGDDCDYDDEYDT